MEELRPLLNVTASRNTERDWTVQDAYASGVLRKSKPIPKELDLRERWWKIYDQGQTGACVGYATAYGVLWWHYAKAGLLQSTSSRNRPSARFIWMANKETDGITSFPTTFLEAAGTQLKSALDIARKYGCVLERDLPMSGQLSKLPESAFYSKASQLKIKAYYNLGSDQEDWKRWLAFQGPILTRLVPDKQFLKARGSKRLERYQFSGLQGGHAVVLCGFDADGFVVRNSWKSWGERGHVRVSWEYAKDAFREAYGVGV